MQAASRSQKTASTIATFLFVKVEHGLPPKNAMSPMVFDPGTSPTVNHRCINWANGDLH